MVSPDNVLLQEMFWASEFVADNLPWDSGRHKTVSDAAVVNHTNALRMVLDITCDLHDSWEHCVQYHQLDLVENFCYGEHSTGDLEIALRPKRQNLPFRVHRHTNHVLLLFCFVTNIVHMKWKRASIMNLITKSSNWHASGGVRHVGSVRYCSLFWWILVGLLTPAVGVTCNSCFDGIEGCTGGAACLFATRTAANLAALTVAGHSCGSPRLHH